MRRQRRKRSTRRRGLQHIGDVLSVILTDVDHEDAEETRMVEPTNRPEEIATPYVSAAATVPGSNSQSTFSFYQPVTNG